jgi:hypothetical protein
MYTVEFRPDHAVVTVLDESASYDDVQMIINEDNTVYITQYMEDADQQDTVIMSYQQLLDIVASIRSPEGAFYARLTKGAKGYGKVDATK